MRKILLMSLLLVAVVGCAKSGQQADSSGPATIASGKTPSQPSGGGGSDVGNGGSVITLPDGRVVVADPYFDRPEQGDLNHYSDFSEAIRQEIELVGRLLVRLGAAVDENVDLQFPPQMSRGDRSDAIDQVRLGRKLSRAAQARFIVESVADPVVEYHFVEHIPSGCHSDDYVAPGAGGPVVMGGCNQGDAVWFQKDIFRSMTFRDGDPADPREQVKWIIHERLHAINLTGHPHYYIFDITNGIDVLLDLYKAQSKGERPVVTTEQRTKLALLVERIAQFRGLTPDGGRDDRFVSDWLVSPNGGGLIHKSATVDATAYIGVGSMLGSGGSLGPGSEFINALCYLASCSLGQSAYMRDALVAPRVSKRASSPGEQSAGVLSVSLAKSASMAHTSLYLDLPTRSDVASGAVLDESATLDGSVFSGITSLHVGQGAGFAGRLEVEVRDDASTAVDLGAGSKVLGFGVSFRTHPAAAAVVRKISVSPGAIFEFDGSICRPPLVPWLLNEVRLDQLDAHCAPIGSL